LKRDTALRRYLGRHIEPDLPECPPTPGRWSNVLVIPAYRECASLLQGLATSIHSREPTLVILVLNRPDTDPDASANTPLREALEQRPHDADGIHQLNTRCDLLCHDLESLAGPTPRKQGVGLARKTGCDIALRWMDGGSISGDWICCTDADALLPPDYFARLSTVPSSSSGALFPFEHTPGPDPDCNRATVLYELRLHHYVLGLEYASSPYAFHTLGSSLAVRASVYAAVRGFPRRSGGEDFYLLNKASKMGPLTRLGGQCIALQSRLSSRVPFGTGPAVREIALAGNLQEQPRFYHPLCFEALRTVLLAVPALQTADLAELAGILIDGGLPSPMARQCSDILNSMGLESAITHCRKQGSTPEQFLRQFHQWFDAFRTLKFIHALRERAWPDQSMVSLSSLRPQLWPDGAGDGLDMEIIREAARRYWGWN
jgi:hypothetical protein